MHNAGKRLSQLVNDFFDLQRIEEGRFMVSTERLKLDDLLREGWSCSHGSRISTN